MHVATIAQVIISYLPRLCTPEDKPRDFKSLPRSRLPGTVLTLRGKRKRVLSHHSLIIQMGKRSPG